MNQIKNIIVAFQFLTSIPINVKTDENNLKNSIAYFPLVGAVIGAILYSVFYLLNLNLNINIASALTILAYIILTRGLHLDGMMDTIDGFFSYKDRATILKIMKEPTVGSFAVLIAIVWGLLFFSALPQISFEGFILIFTLSRYNTIIMPLVFSYPRESGTGKFFVENVNIKVFMTATALALIPILIFNIVYIRYMIVSLVIALLSGLWAKKMIGGITGDVLGFTMEVTNLILLILMVSR